ncbi:MULTISPECIES: cadherin-like beta sandwich domain-containing protein, partial [unclassified Paenibacillus]|uniref:cadherin-like beta sandwich domain-containing protein n=1 Tax=unclassified Paenibacillus TaxID=185978 RepID=UPI00362C4FB2
AMSGTGWTCDTDTLTCTRSDALAAGQSYDAITLTVNVAATAAASLTSSVTVAGGNDTNTGNNTASDLTTVALAADLIVAQSQSGAFVQVQKGATYTITVTNNKGAGTTSGAVTVTDILPMGLIATAMDGMGWTCNAGTLTCTRSDALAADQSYPAITLTVDVASDAPATLTNKVEVSGGGELNVSNNIDTGVNSVYHRPELIALTLSSGTIALSSAFRPETFNYNANVGNLVESTTVTATTYDDSTSRLEITLNGKSYASGDSIPIHAGQNEILLKVTSTINNTTSQTYTINVTRASSSNAELSDLRLSSDNVSSFISISPMFSPTQVNYQASVTDSVYQVYVYATPNDAYSSITVSGATYGASLSGGIPVRLSLDSETLITIEVTAQDRSKTETYTIKVLRAAIIGSGNGNEIRVTFSDAIRPAGINLEKFKVNINNQTVSVSQAVYDYSDRLGRTVVLKLEREIRYGESISLEIADGAVKYLNNTDSSKTSVQVTNSVILSMQIRRELAALDAEHDGIGINEILKWINNNKYDLTGDGKFDSKDVMLLLQQIDRVRH